MTRSLRSHWPITLILAAFLSLGVTYSIVNPLFESPDEVWHYEYVRWVVEGRGLPTPSEVGSAPWHQEGSQPPLYYLAAALLTKPISTSNAASVIRYNPHAEMGRPESTGNKNVMVHGPAEAWPWQGVTLAAHIARFFSILLGAVTVLCTYLAALVLFPGRRGLAGLAACLVAFNPQFLFVSAAVNNDNLVVACSAAGVWLALRMIMRSAVPGQSALRSAFPALALGALTGAAALAKLSGLALAAVVAVAIAWRAWRSRSIRFFLVQGSAAAVAAAAVGGWWYARNWLLYHDPLGLQAMFDVMPARSTSPGLAEVLNRGQGVWRSAWGVFGWFNVPAPDWLIAIYSGLCVAGVAGLLLLGVTKRSKARGDRLAGFVLLAVWVAIVTAALLAWAQMRYPQGRLLFPALPAAGVLLAAGLGAWIPRRIRRVAGAALGAGLVGLAAATPLLWIAPVYARPAPAEIGSIPSGSQGATFAGGIQLLGYQAGTAAARPGGRLPVTLYWRAGQAPDHDYSVFVHLVDEHGIIQAQDDSYPAGGNWPTSQWQPGVVVPDLHVVEIPGTAPSPVPLQVLVGIYDYATGQRLAADNGDEVRVGGVSLASLPDEAGLHAVGFDFGGKLKLRGFDFDPALVQPGETLTVTMEWQWSQSARRDYVAFVHLLLPPDAVWAQQDRALPAAPATNASGTFVETYHLALPANAPPGTYRIEIGVYDPATEDRLPVDFVDRGIILGEVQVGGK